MIYIKTDLAFLEKVKSKIDKTVKYIFLSRGQVIEFSYINKGDGKDIICAPTQTACNLGCKFCFLSDYDLSVRNLEPEEITVSVDYVINDLNLLKQPNKNQILLVSFMGCGEPLFNIKNVAESCRQIKIKYQNNYNVVRFAVASLIPNLRLMRDFIEVVKQSNIMLKFHLSLHSPNEQARKKIMPSASPILESVILTEFFTRYTGNSAEIHYALIEGVNDGNADLSSLVDLLEFREIPVKFLVYNKKPSIDFKESPRVQYFRNHLESAGVKTEFYNPPGSDIGSSCGQFLMDYYKRYNKKS